MMEISLPEVAGMMRDTRSGGGEDSKSFDSFPSRPLDFKQNLTKDEQKWKQMSLEGRLTVGNFAPIRYLRRRE